MRSVRHGERERDGSTSCLADWYQAITVDEEQRRHRDTHLLDGAHFVCTQALSGGCGYSLFVCTPRFPTLFAHVSCCCVSRLFAHTQHSEVKKPSSFCFAHQAVEQQRRHAHRDGTSTSAPSGCLHAHTHIHTHTRRTQLMLFPHKPNWAVGVPTRSLFAHLVPTLCLHRFHGDASVTYLHTRQNAFGNRAHFAPHAGRTLLTARYVLLRSAHANTHQAGACGWYALFAHNCVHTFVKTSWQLCSP